METEEVRKARRKARIEEMKREKHKRELLQKWGVPATAVLAVLIGAGLGVGIAGFSHKSSAGQKQEEIADVEGQSDGDTQFLSAAKGIFDTTGNTFYQTVQTSAQGFFVAENSLFAEARTMEPPSPPLADPIPAPAGIFEMTEGTEGFSEDILSQYGIFVDAQSGSILAQAGAFERMNPASMTKILTVLVAAEHLTEADLEETATITIDITDYSYVNDCSNTGYALDEVVTIRDLFYGTILPSGADSALALAKYVAGSHEAFVDLMNEKLAQLGLAESSHFTNCVGLYDENHYTTAYDMAVILKAAVDNPFCRDVLSAHIYRTSETEQHPEGLLVSNWFLRRIEDRDTHGEVLCAKTGFVDQSGSCAASLGLDSQGREYLCVTAGSISSWTCIADHVALYQRFLPEIPVTQEDAS